eukprot:GILJ01013950.1.p1 GENE.GILJ01013950.1~~GILJ01013950.1.p1  ORF type:complete len:579 (-),score=57.16 GILJ01013950.1:78-1682(-)
MTDAQLEEWRLQKLLPEWDWISKRNKQLNESAYHRWSLLYSKYGDQVVNSYLRSKNNQCSTEAVGVLMGNLDYFLSFFDVEDPQVATLLRKCWQEKPFSKIPNNVKNLENLETPLNNLKNEMSLVANTFADQLARALTAAISHSTIERESVVFRGVDAIYDEPLGNGRFRMRGFTSTTYRYSHTSNYGKGFSAGKFRYQIQLPAGTHCLPMEGSYHESEILLPAGVIYEIVEPWKRYTKSIYDDDDRTSYGYYIMATVRIVDDNIQVASQPVPPLRHVAISHYTTIDEMIKRNDCHLMKQTYLGGVPVSALFTNEEFLGFYHTVLKTISETEDFNLEFWLTAIPQVTYRSKFNSSDQCTFIEKTYNKLDKWANHPHKVKLIHQFFNSVIDCTSTFVQRFVEHNNSREWYSRVFSHKYLIVVPWIYQEYNRLLLKKATARNRVAVTVHLPATLHTTSPLLHQLTTIFIKLTKRVHAVIDCSDEDIKTIIRQNVIDLARILVAKQPRRTSKILEQDEEQEQDDLLPQNETWRMIKG